MKTETSEILERELSLGYWLARFPRTENMVGSSELTTDQLLGVAHLGW